MASSALPEGCRSATGDPWTVCGPGDKVADLEVAGDGESPMRVGAAVAATGDASPTEEDGSWSRSVASWDSSRIVADACDCGSRQGGEAGDQLVVVGSSGHVEWVWDGGGDWGAVFGIFVEARWEEND
jgi:hypothetical protein